MDTNIKPREPKILLIFELLPDESQFFLIPEVEFDKFRSKLDLIHNTMCNGDELEDEQQEAYELLFQLVQNKTVIDGKEIEAGEFNKYLSALDSKEATNIVGVLRCGMYT